MGDALGQAIAALDYLRGPPVDPPGAVGHKEWLHFCVQDAGVELLVNFSFMATGSGEPRARTVLLWRESTWEGSVEEPAEVFAPPGGMAMRLGGHGVTFRRGGFDLVLQSGRVRGALRLEPATFPMSLANVSLERGHRLRWVVVPRLRASGEVTVDGRRHVLRDAPAYHDHNWGLFAWGSDFAWDWGFALPLAPDNPWSLVFSCVSNAGRTVVQQQALALWHGDRQVRLFRDAELTLERGALRRPGRLTKVPPVMALLSPGTATDVPATLIVRARAQTDEATVTFRAGEIAPILVPNDGPRGVTAINEVTGTVSAHGFVAGRRVELEGRGVFEFLGR